MPFYEYKCRSCGHVHTDVRWLREIDNPPPVCPKCDHPESDRLLGKTTLKFHGGGWTTNHPVV